MAGETTNLTIVLNAKNLTGPAFKEVTSALGVTNAALKTSGATGQKAGADIAAGMGMAGKSASTAADAIAKGLGVAIPLSAAAAATAVVAFGVDSVKSFAEFDKNVRGVNSLLGLTGEESKKSFTGMSADIRAFATRMGVDGTQAAKALYDAISAGVPVGKAAFNVLEVATKAAIGGMTDTATATNGLTSVLNAYKLTADQAGKVSDQMFQTVNLGKVTFGELSSTIGKVTPIAAAAGIGFDQVGAAVASMTKQGISAGAATTDLQQIIQAYIKPTTDAADVAKLLGINFNATTLQTKGLHGALNEAAAAAGGDKEALARLFGSVEALNGVLALTGDNAQGAADDLKSIAGSSGAAQKAFEELDAGASRSFERMQAKVSDMQLSLGTKLIPVLENVVHFVDLVGQNLGLWPKDVPAASQTAEMRNMASAAQQVADAVLAARDAYNSLDKAIRDTQTSGTSPEAAGRRAADAAKGAAAAVLGHAAAQVAAAKATDAYADAEAKLTANLTAAANAQDTEGVAKYTAGLAELRAARQADNEANAASIDGNLLAAAAMAEATQATVESAQATIEAAAAEAKAQRDAAAAQAQADAGRKASIQERLDAQKAAAAEAKKAEDEAARATKAATDKAIADAKRWAEQVGQANEQGTKSYRKLTSDIEDIVDDGNGRLQEIRDRHDQNYNQAIIDAQRDQAKIFEDGKNDRIKIEDEAGRRVAEVQAKLNDLQADQDAAAVDHRLQENRRAADQEVQDNQRAEDRKLEATRRADDLRIAQEERNADRRLRADRQRDDRRLEDEEKAEERRLDRVKANADREAQIRDDAAKRRDIETGAGDDASEREKANARDVADAKKQYDRDVARENSDYADALADDEDGKNRARLDREHQQALDRLKERFDDDAAKREERYADEETKAQAQLERDLARADVAAKKRLDDLKAREDEQIASEDRADKREVAARKLSDDRAKEDQETADRRDKDQRKVQDDRDRQDRETADRRDKDARTLRESRDREDWNTQRKRAADAFQDDIDKINDKKKEDIDASQAREAASIKASNDTLIEKQRQIDAQRDTDFAKFSEDLSKRFRELGQQFGTAMGDLVAKIPAKVDWFISGGATQIAQAVALLNSGTQPSSTGGPSGTSSGATLRPGGKPGETQAEVDAFNANAAKANEDNIRRAAGLGAGTGEAIDTGQDVFDQIIANLGVELGGINQRFSQALIGGDTATARGEVPKNVSVAGSNENSLSWAQQYLGSHAFDGMCERFVEMANGTSGVFASAKAAADALQTAGGRMEDAPRGMLMFFRPDPSNGNWGHVGISRGGGQMISATNGGVTIDGPSAYWSRLYSGYGAPNFQRRRSGGPVNAHEPVIVGEGGEEVFVPDRPGRIVSNAAIRRGGTAGAMSTGPGEVHFHWHVGTMFGGNPEQIVRDMAPYLQGALDRQVRLRLG